MCFDRTASALRDSGMTTLSSFLDDTQQPLLILHPQVASPFPLSEVILVRSWSGSISVGTT
jgi:hypothetical protein